MNERTSKRFLSRSRTALGHAAGLATLAGVLVVGCALKASAPYPDVASFCTAKANAECQVAATCGLADPTACQTERVSLCNADANAAAMTGLQTRKYTQANAQTCINAVNAAYGNGNTKVAFAQYEGLTDICERVFAGTAGSNEPCQTNYDCAGSNICSPVTPGSTSLVCFAPTQVAEGSPCENPGSVCAADTYCAMASANVAYACTPAKNEGDSCVSAPCVSAQRCEATGATGHTCEPRATIGESCTTNDDCAPAAPYCDPNAGFICTPGLSFATLSADCKAFEAAGGGAVDAGPGPATDAGMGD